MEKDGETFERESTRLFLARALQVPVTTLMAVNWIPRSHFNRGEGSGKQPSCAISERSDQHFWQKPGPHSCTDPHGSWAIIQ